MRQRPPSARPTSTAPAISAAALATSQATIARKCPSGVSRLTSAAV
jgi:hypothetical protein